MSSVKKLLELFDDLDAFEAQELFELLEARGYSLKITKTLRTPIYYGLYLNSYSDSAKIQCIKAIRNLKSQYETKFELSYIINLDLKAAKDFSEMTLEYWIENPLILGKEKQVRQILGDLEQQYENVHFEVVKETNLNKVKIFKNIDYYDSEMI